MTKATLADRFWNNVRKVGHPLGCWIWTAGCIRGYGRFRVGDRGVQAHRWAYEFCVEPIPEGLVIDHLCRVRGCVNPAHLEPVTNRTNILRGVGATAQHARTTHCPRGHLYTGPNLYVRRGRRGCRACSRLGQASYKARMIAQGTWNPGRQPLREGSAGS